MMTTFLSYQVFQRAATAADVGQTYLTPVDERETEYFRENIKKVESPEDLMDDFRLYKFALRAFNMDDQINSRAIVQKSLEGGVEDPESFANQWSDGRYLELARTFGFAELGTENVESESFADFVVAKYNEVTREVVAGEENPGVRLAAFFKRNASEFTNWYQPLSSTALREVVITALQVPDSAQTQTLDTLVTFLESRFDVEDFQDPDKLDAFIDRFLIMYDLENNQITSSTTTRFSSALTILTAGSSGSSLFNLTL